MVKKICNILSNIIIVILLVIAGLIFVPMVLGYDEYAVVSGSMQPNIPVGSLVYAKECTIDNLEKGDIVTFQLSDSTIITHRIYEIDQEGNITTKGDANQQPDGQILTIDNIIGKVGFSIPLLGFVSVYIKSALGVAVICGVIFILLLLNFLPEMLAEKEKE